MNPNFWAATCSSVLLVACQDTVPASIEFSTAAGVILGSEEVPLRAAAKNKKGEVLKETLVTFSSAPADVAVVTQQQGLRCTKSGDVTVTASATPATSNVVFRCRQVAKISAPKEIRLIMPNAAVEPKIVALDSTGKPFGDVAPVLSVQDAAIASVSSSGIEGLKVGRTVLVAKAGDAEASVPVTVVRKVQSQPLLLNDGNRQSHTLQQGKYQVEVKGKASDGSRYGVTLKWVGGQADCQDRSEAQDFTSTCTIENTGALTIENPTSFGMGPSFDGFLNVYEVP